MPDLANVHFDVALTMISLAYKNEMFCADEVFPVVPVDKRSDKYFIYNKDTFLRSSGKDAQGKPQSIRRPGSRSTRFDYDLSNQSYFCEQLAKHHPVLDAELKYEDAPLNADVDATEALTAAVMLDNEIQVAGKAGLRSNYASANKAQLVTTTTSWAANGAPYSTSQSSFPISVDIPAGQKAVMKSLIRAATHMLVNFNTAYTLAANWEYLDKVKYTSTEGLTKGGLAPIIRGLRVIEADSQYATSDENITPVTTGMVWVDDQGQDACLIFYRDPSGGTGLKRVSYGLTFEAPDDSLGGRGFQTKRWLEPWNDAEMIEVRTTRDWRFTATDGSTNGDNASGYASGGYLISGTTL